MYVYVHVHVHVYVYVYVHVHVYVYVYVYVYVSEEKHIAKVKLLKTFELPTISQLITQKRMRWVGHALRRNNSDRSKRAVIETLNIKESPWTKLVKKDCKQLKIPWKKIRELALNRSDFRHVTHWRTFKKWRLHANMDGWYMHE